MADFDRNAELALFKQLASHPKLEEWVRWKLESERDTLTSALDIDQVRKAQGRAQLLQTMIKLLEASRFPPRP